MIPITIVYAILIFVILIFVHELGHFLAAKACGVLVNEFAIGLGPAIFKKQWGETTYAIRALPFGGQCVMEGEDDDSPNPRAFHQAAKWKRFLILIAGVTMNFLMGLVIFLCVYAPVEERAVPVVDELMEKFTGGGESGIQEGDCILSVDGYRILFTTDISMAFARSEDYDFDVVVRRDGKRIELSNVHIEPQEYIENGKSVMYYGFRYEVQELGFFGKIRLALLESVSMVRLVFESLGMIFSGNASLNDMTGPVGITAAMSTVAQQSMSSFWYMAGLIAINLAVMNALPIPALDGGRIFFLLVEAITRRKLNWKAEAIMNGAVLILLLGFMLVVTANDIWRLIK